MPILNKYDFEGIDSHHRLPIYVYGSLTYSATLPSLAARSSVYPQVSVYPGKDKS